MKSHIKLFVLIAIKYAGRFLGNVVILYWDICLWNNSLRVRMHFKMFQSITLSETSYVPTKTVWDISELTTYFLRCRLLTKKIISRYKHISNTTCYCQKYFTNDQIPPRPPGMMEVDMDIGRRTRVCDKWTRACMWDQINIFGHYTLGQK